MYKVSFFIFILCWILSPLYAQRRITIDQKQVDQLVKEWKDSLQIPGISAVIAVGDEIEYISAFGFADLETKTPLNINSVWHICSVSKQFSTVACMKLVEESKLSLQDHISKYIDHLPPEYSEITIRNLLSHTSGIKDYLNEEKLYGFSWDTVKSKVFSDALNFTPGSAWSYSNTGFWIVAKIIEEISGMDYNQYLQQNFFVWLEMKDTKRVSDGKNWESRVKGYEYKATGYVRPELDIEKFQGQGDGDIVSTLSDLIKWNAALVQGKIITKEMVSSMWMPVKYNSGEIIEVMPKSGMNYGMGWFTKIFENERIVWTPGSGFGFSSILLYFPKYDLTITVFCNRDQFLLADEVAFAMIQLLLK